MNSFRILLLGDGNFSFSLALARHIQNNNEIAWNYLGIANSIKSNDIHIIATSFDSHKQLISKYDDAAIILSHLEKFKNVSVLHEVNAWELPLHFENIRFNAISLLVWNHPHLGTEDFRLHQFLMAHFFDSAVKVLKTDNVNEFMDEPFVRISLVQGQELRWNVHNQAGRTGLQTKSIELFNELLWPGYVVKRNKHGGSFKNAHTKRHVRTTMKSCVHTFSLNCLNPIPTEDIHPLLETLFGESFDSTFDMKPLIDAVGDLTPQKVNLHKKNRKQKPPAPADLKCIHCAKQLSSARAYHQHVHAIHEVLEYGSDWQNRPKTFICEKCGKGFRDEEAIWQHSINRHTTIQPNELPTTPDALYANETSNTNDADYAYYPCEVCGQSCIKQEWGKELHLESLKPSIGLDMVCPLCPSRFIEQRALYQHFKFCRAKQHQQSKWHNPDL
ncbi:hypothetical protein BC833DRAFT_527182 [Globomyces pollinis-pini]|nr:hypothetical protein BC833DRAFT_527182 [Globomyces pollinis-pini]